MHDQVVSPNLAVTGKSGYCLSMQEEVWGAAHWYDYAEEAWNASGPYNHPDQLPPDDVSVLLYWTYYDTADEAEYGHVATWVPGRGVYSSTFNTAYGAEWYPSVQAMTDRINRIPGANGRFLGWSEAIANVIVVQPQGVSEDMQIETSAPVFDANYYLQMNQDIAQAGVDPVQHWLNTGIDEGRPSAPNFHVAEYIANYGDLVTAIGKDYRTAVHHYFSSGIEEGRYGTAAAKQATDNAQAAVVQLKAAVDSVVNDDNATRASLQDALAKVADLTKQLASTQSQPTSITPTQQTQLSTLSAIKKWVLGLFGITSN